MDTSLQPAAPSDRTDLPQDGEGLGLTGPRTNPLLPANLIAQRSNGPVRQSDVDAFISLLDEPGNAGLSDETASSAHAAGAQAASAQAASGSLSEMTLGLRRQWEGAIKSDTAANAPTTQALAADASATQAPAVDASATQAPAVDASATQAPVVDAPVTQAPAVDASATQAPAATLGADTGARIAARRHADDSDDIASAPTDAPLPQVNMAAAIPNPVAPATPVSTTGTEARSVQWGSDNIADVVRHVTRTLGLRDLDALQSGREVVLQLDATVLPDTALHFRADGSEAVILLQTGSNDVQQFLDDHLDQLLSAMAAEVPGLRWTMAPEMVALAPRAIMPASDASDGSSTGDRAGRDSGGNAGGGSGGQSGGQSGNQPGQQRDAQDGLNTAQGDAPSLGSTVASFEAEVATAPR